MECLDQLSSTNLPDNDGNIYDPLCYFHFFLFGNGDEIN